MVRIIHKKLLKFSDKMLLVIAVAITLFVGLMDLLTGYRLAFSVFYLIPVFLASYYLDLLSGIFIAVLSAVLWFLADFIARGSYLHFIIPLWNTCIRLSVFLVLAFILHNMRVAQKKQSDLMHFIVHDLRTPLAIVLDGLYLLKKEADEKQRKLADLCVISCKRMSTLIDSIVDVSRFENGKMPIHLRKEKLKELLEAAIEGVSVWANHNGVKVVLEYGTELIELETDEELLRRILVNLLSNAIKWSPSGTTVTVRVSTPADERILFSIKDMGSGIPKNLSKKVFNKFTQLEGKQEVALKGSGLGLNFCKFAVEELDGRIWINSDKGKGTEVVFELPMRI